MIKFAKNLQKARVKSYVLHVINYITVNPTLDGEKSSYQFT